MDTRNIRFYSNGRRTQNKIALTFDDGPTPDVTDQVLQIMGEKKVRGNFFVVGKWIDWLPHGPQMLKRIVEAGHVIGNHSYSHDKPAHDYAQAEAVIQRITGQPTVFARAPYLAMSTTLADWAGTRKIVGSDVWGYDWEPEITTRKIGDNLINGCQNGSILLLHDGSEVETERIARPARMVAALPRIIDELRGRGFEFVGLDQMEFDWPEQIGW